MGNKGQKAKELFMQGYNCSQAVVGAYAEDLGMDMKTALMVSSAFGGGMGRLREVCGAVTGMFMVLGMKYGYDNPAEDYKRKDLYAKVQEKAKEFQAENGSIVCKELLGLALPKDNGPFPEARTKAYYKKRPCPELVEYAADLLEEYF